MRKWTAARINGLNYRACTHLFLKNSRFRSDYTRADFKAEHLQYSFCRDDPGRVRHLLRAQSPRYRKTRFRRKCYSDESGKATSTPSLRKTIRCDWCSSAFVWNLSTFVCHVNALFTALMLFSTFLTIRFTNSVKPNIYYVVLYLPLNHVRL